MRFRVITKDKQTGYGLGKRDFNTLSQAINFIKSDVKQYTKGDFMRLFSEGIEAGEGFKYKAIYFDKYNRARIITWQILEAIGQK